MLKKLTVTFLVLCSLGTANAKVKERARTYHTCTSADTPQNILACAMYFEARSEGEKGMTYVGNVIMNRRNHDEYPSKMSKVVYQKHQFSYVRKRLKVQDKISWDAAQHAAGKLLSMSDEKRRLTDPTKGAIMFVKKGRKAYWIKKYVRTTSYGKHVFYRERTK